MEQLIKALEQTREKNGMTQTEMAARLKISESFYSLVINGKRQPGRGFIVGAIQAFPELINTLRVAA